MATLETSTKFEVGYAKTARSSCYGCKQTIDKGVLRIGVICDDMTGSYTFPRWHHFECFKKHVKKHPANFTATDQVSGLDTIKFDDAAPIRALAVAGAGGADNNGMATLETSKKYSTDYAKSSRSTCVECNVVIDKGVLRLGVVVDDPSGSFSFPKWHHFECFKNHVKKHPANFTATDQISGLDTLKFDDAAQIRALVVAGAGDDDAAAVGDKKQDKKLKKLSDELFALREKLSALKTSELVEMLDENKQPHAGPTFGGRDAILNRCADGMLYGSLPKCPRCKSGHLMSDAGGALRCASGHVDEFTKCEWRQGAGGAGNNGNDDDDDDDEEEEEEVKRHKWKIPDDLKEEHDFLDKFKFKKKTKIVVSGAADAERLERVMSAATQQLMQQQDAGGEDGAAAAAVAEETAGARRGRAGEKSKQKDGPAEPELRGDLPLAGVTVAAAGRVAHATVEEKTKKLGGTFKKTAKGVDVVVMTKTESEGKGSAKGKDAVAAGILCVGEAWLEEVETAGHMIKAGDNVLANPSDDKSSSSNKKSSSKKNKKKKGDADDDDSDDDDDDDELMIAEDSDYLPEEKEKSSSSSSGKKKSAATAATKAGAPQLLAVDAGLRKFVVNEGGGAVDPDAMALLAEHDITHASVAKSSSNMMPYTAALSMADVAQGKTQIYVLAVLNAGGKYWTFRKWGNPAAAKFGTKLTPHSSLSAAAAEFESVFLDKTGNVWSAVAQGGKFQKKPGKFLLIETEFASAAEQDAARNDGGDDGDDDDPFSAAVKKKSSGSGSGGKKSQPADSGLDKSTEDLMRILFDQQQQQKVLREMEIDTSKMPLGALAQATILQGQKALKDAEGLLQAAAADGTKVDKTKLLSISNRFYSFIPHVVAPGKNQLPLLDNADIIASKVELLESLEQMRFVARAIEGAADSAADGEAAQLRAHYESLNTELAPVAAGSDEFEMVKQYAANTHGATHNMYTIEVQGLWRVERRGESERFKSFLKTHDRELLWHGSRRTNFANILRTGLRIAPPEAPATGYMFNKALYFANASSKSANYLYATSSDCVGLMALCDVAVGSSQKFNAAHMVEGLPNADYQSAYGVGKWTPDPAGDYYLDDGCKVPMGNLVENKELKQFGGKSTLLYDEKMVYTVEQCKMRYLLQVRLNYNIKTGNTFH